MSHTIPCSALVLTRNSAATLEACLNSIKDIEDIVLVDGYSADTTREIAKKFSNVRIIDQDKQYADAEGRIIDYASVRNQGLQAAKHDWIVMVDSDEVLPDSFIDEVRAIVAENKPGVYNAFRRFVINGERVIHCAGYPAYQIRVFHRSCTTGFVKIVHERLELNAGVEARVLRSEILTPLPEASTLWPKYERYLKLETRHLSDRTWGTWFTRILLKKLKTIIGILLRSLIIRLTPRKGLAMPFAYEWLSVRYAMALIVRTFPLRRI